MNNEKRLLLIDDDDTLRKMLAEQLQLHEEFSIIEANTGAEALEHAKLDYYDVIILDVGLPDMDGRDVCRLMRRAGVKSPITVPGAVALGVIVPVCLIDPVAALPK